MPKNDLMVIDVTLNRHDIQTYFRAQAFQDTKIRRFYFRLLSWLPLFLAILFFAFKPTGVPLVLGLAACGVWILFIHRFFRRFLDREGQAFLPWRN
ncbi:hypothetical protein [Holdemania filiformis]|uniref:hypothetical protein n=1 Tax=Holdemania filiformis TaxID=61171 RepID=UPI00242FA1FB|nr:hypothetical protein [Holdemania filiformis]